MEKCPEMALNGARRIFVPTHPDLADILGRTDLHFEICYCLNPKFLDFQVSRFPNSQTKAWAKPGPDLGRLGHFCHSTELPNSSTFPFHVCHSPCFLQVSPAEKKCKCLHQSRQVFFMSDAGIKQSVMHNSQLTWESLALAYLQDPELLSSNARHTVLQSNAV